MGKKGYLYLIVVLVLYFLSFTFAVSLHSSATRRAKSSTKGASDPEDAIRYAARIPRYELSEGAGFDDKGVYCSVCVAPSSLCIGCIVGLNVYITSECCFSRTLIDSPEGNKPNRNCFLEMHAFDFYSRNQKQQKTNELAQRTSGFFDIRE
ncbi:PREDICTED: uncharacterized protein LOC107329366 [Acropora digitifera]|uniref:uncharacterized protein LOC107329366 n=1 Tax=Acropora digitifera TaxID=70779 RepID=UPI00077A624C|nr:PREDICTED: uncharacterized protein LOC107329366 [Acropora digitifera]